MGGCREVAACFGVRLHSVCNALLCWSHRIEVEGGLGAMHVATYSCPGALESAGVWAGLRLGERLARERALGQWTPRLSFSTRCHVVPKGSVIGESCDAGS